MKNLKKVLSLVLALAMALSLMTVAFAKDASDYTDYGTITNKEAVEVLTALEVIDGMGNNTFQPTGNVTRAQMAKMITIISLGNVDATAFLGTQTDLKDINGHWGEAYIKYCYSQGIISGRGNGVFDPNANVTSAEAAKMLLVAIGYNSNVQGYTGAQWAINVTRDAQLKGFYKDVSVPSNQALTRDEAAQMIWNAVQAQTVKQSKSQNTETGVVTISYVDEFRGNTNVPETLLHKTFEAEVEYTYMTDVTYDEDKAEYTYTFAEANGTFGAVAIDNTVDFSLASDTLTTDIDVTNLYGQQVKVIYKNNAKDSYPVYGIYANKSDVLLSGTIGDLPDDLTATASSMKVDGKTYNFKAWSGAAMMEQAQYVDVYAYVNGAIATVGGLDNLAADVTANRLENEWKFDLIDNDGDGKANCMVVYPFTVEKVTYVGSENITLDSGVGSLDLEDINVYDGIAKDDYVAHTAPANTVDNKDTFTKAEVITGTVDAVKDTNSVQIGGTWYTWAGNYANGAVLTNTNLGATVKIQVVNGYYFDSEVTLAEANANMLYISAADTAVPSLGVTTVKAKAYFADGTYKTITIDKVNNSTNAPVTVGLTTNAPATGNYATNNTNVVVGMMYRYTTDSDGNYELYALANDTTVNKANYDLYAMQAASNISYNSVTARLQVGTNYLAVPDDAVVFVQTTQGTGAETKVVTGKALKNWNWGGMTVANLTTQVLTQTVSGVPTVKVMTIVNSTNNATISGADSTAYGYVLSGPVEIKVDGTNCEQYVIWNGSEEITVYWTGTNSGVAKGDFVSYEVESADEITKPAPIATAYAVTGLSENDTVLDLVNEAGATVTAAKIDDDDTTVIYVNTKDVKGVAGGSVTLANEIADGAYEMNVVAATNGNGQAMDVIFVDVNNKVAGTVAVNSDTMTKELPNGKETTKADMASLPEGVYLVKDIEQYEMFDDMEAGDNAIFNFAGTNGTEYKLDILNSSDSSVYDETKTVSANNSFFYINLDGLNGSGNGTYKTTAFAAGTYTYTVTPTSGGSAAVLSGTFIVK